MPSQMLPIIDPAITRGMNTVDDPKLLKPGECVRLLNAFPGNPPIPRTGCTGKLIASSSAYTFLPPGISFEYGNKIYIVAWVYNPSTLKYTLVAVDKDAVSPTLGSLGVAEFAAADIPLFDLLYIHSCVYCSVSASMTKWKDEATTALGHKVIESGTVVRDMCLSNVFYAPTSSYLPYSDVNEGALAPGFYEYAFQSVRRNDSDAFEAGGAIAGIILPPNITSTWKPKRIDTFLPGVCLGVEGPEFSRVVVEVVETPWVAAAGMLSTGAGAEAVGAFSAAQCTDLNTTTVGFNVDAATAGAWVKFDFDTEGGGTGQTRCIEKLELFTNGAGSTNSFKLQYYDSSWIDASVPSVLAVAGWNTISGYEPNAHRYWRLLLVDAGVAGPDFMEVRCTFRSKVIVPLGHDYYGLAQGATHTRISRSLVQATAVLAQGATKFFLADAPMGTYADVYPGYATTFSNFEDTTSNEALEGETNQLITGYSAAPPAAFIEYLKGRMYLMAIDGRVYFSESVGGDGGTDLATAQASPQAWSSLFKPTEYLLDCDCVDGQQATGMKRLGDDIFFWKERKIFAVFGGDPTSTSLSQVSNTVGCAFPYTLTKCEIKGMFGKCILFLGNDGPMVMEEGGRVRPFSEFKIKQFWPDRSAELYSELDLNYETIVKNCTAAFFKNTWWILYKTAAGVNKIFGYYFDPGLAAGDAPNGPLEFQFADM